MKTFPPERIVCLTYALAIIDETEGSKKDGEIVDIIFI
jgi:hypothetical protein